MALIVQKYGGTSVGDIERIKSVAGRVAARRQEGNDLVVVLSAMAGVTNRLVKEAAGKGHLPCSKEYDKIVSRGEQVSIAHLRDILLEMGIKAVAMLGHEVPIRTDSTFGSARIESIGTENIRDNLKEGRVVVVAGFQGVSPGGDVTTLGRGGSDTTAVAIAAAMGADICEIYTDVEGIFTTDPGICADARKLKKVSYEEMLEMAGLGAKVLQTRSVEFARRYNVPLMVRSSFSADEGTLVCEEDEDMEKAQASGVTYNKNEAKISIIRVPDEPGVAVKIFRPLSEANINVDMIVQNISHDGHTDMTFTVPKGDYEKAHVLIEPVANEVGAADVTGDFNIAKVSIVGAGMKSHAGVATKVFETLSSEGINIEMISTSEIKISCVIKEKDTERAVIVLHDAFGLSKEDITEEN